MPEILQADLSFSLAHPTAALSADEGVRALFGYTAEDFLSGRVTLQELIHADDQDIAEALFSRGTGRSSGSVNLRLRQANGLIRCCKGQFTKVPDPARGSLLLLTLQDAKSLWRSEGDQPLLPNFRAMMENTDDYIYFKDRNHVFTGASQTLVAITNPSEHWTDLLGQTDYDVFPEAYADVYYRLEKQVFAGIPVAHEIQETLDNEGRKGWVDNRKYPIRNERDEIIGLFGIARIITEQKRAEEALRESEEALRESQAIAGLGSYVVELASGTWKASAELRKILGIDLAYGAEVENGLALIHPEDRTWLTDEVRSEVLGAGRPLDRQFRILRQGDQSERWVHALGRVHCDAQQRPLTLRGTIQDITERRHELLAEQRAILSNRLVGIITARDRVIGWANPALEAMLGYAPNELTGASARELYFTEEEFQAMASAYTDIWSSAVVRSQCRFRRKDGQPIWVEVGGAALQERSHESLWVVIDISARKQAEEAVRESEEKFRSFVERSTDVIFSLDANGVFHFASRAWERHFGFPVSDVLGKTFSGFVHPEDIQSCADLLARVLATGLSETSLPFRVRHADGSWRWFVANGTREDLPNGEFRFLGVAHDITEGKIREEEHARFQAQLIQTQKMESLGSLAGGVAHDINNVLGAILGLASAHIGSQPYGSPLHRALDTICKATERGGKMVKGLLSFARQTPAEERVLDVNAIVREQVELLERTTLARVHLRVDLEGNLRPILGDASALTHAVMNLCVNAIDAMPDKGTLTIHTRNVEGDEIEVVVEDTGTGMPRAVLEKCLDPFYTTKEVGKGTGLGLSMVYSTVKAHRGRLQIESEPGHGTRVRLRFPACGEGCRTAELPDPVAEGWAQGPLKVLLVDDDELIQTSMQATLEILGHSVKLAGNGEDALAELAAGYEPDLVILDMNMPGLGGAGTLPRLRALQPGLPVLLTTGRTDQSALDLAAAHPSVSLLPKPFGMRELQKYLEAFGRG